MHVAGHAFATAYWALRVEQVEELLLEPQQHPAVSKGYLVSEWAGVCCVVDNFGTECFSSAYRSVCIVQVQCTSIRLLSCHDSMPCLAASAPVLQHV